MLLDLAAVDLLGLMLVFSRAVRLVKYFGVECKYLCGCYCNISYGCRVRLGKSLCKAKYFVI